MRREIFVHFLCGNAIQSQPCGCACSREMILGEEARSRVPAEFVEQHPDAANPPTLFLPIMTLAKALTTPNSSLLSDSSVTREALQDFTGITKDHTPRTVAVH